jgi:hypothetical protein
LIDDGFLSIMNKYSSSLAVQGFLILHGWLMNKDHIQSNEVVLEQFPYSLKTIQLMHLGKTLSDRQLKEQSTELVLLLLNSKEGASVTHFTESQELIEHLNWLDKRNKFKDMKQVVNTHLKAETKLAELEYFLENYPPSLFESFLKKETYESEFESRVEQSRQIAVLKEENASFREKLAEIEKSLLEAQANAFERQIMELKEQNNTTFGEVFERFKGVDERLDDLHVAQSKMALGESVTSEQLVRRPKKRPSVSKIDEEENEDEPEELVPPAVLGGHLDRLELRIMGSLEKMEEGIRRDFIHVEDFQEEFLRFKETLERSIGKHQMAKEAQSGGEGTVIRASLSQSPVENELGGSSFDVKELIEENNRMIIRVTSEMVEDRVREMSKKKSESVSLDEFKARVGESLQRVNLNFEKQAEFNERIEECVVNLMEEAQMRDEAGNKEKQGSGDAGAPPIDLFTEMLSIKIGNFERRLWEEMEARLQSIYQELKELRQIYSLPEKTKESLQEEKGNQNEQLLKEIVLLKQKTTDFESAIKEIKSRQNQNWEDLEGSIFKAINVSNGEFFVKFLDRLVFEKESPLSERVVILNQLLKSDLEGKEYRSWL